MDKQFVLWLKMLGVYIKSGSIKKSETKQQNVKLWKELHHWLMTEACSFFFINATIFSTLHTGFYVIFNCFYSNKLLVIRIFDNPQIFITTVTKVIPLWKVFHRKYSEITWWYVLYCDSFICILNSACKGTTSP